MSTHHVHVTKVTSAKNLVGKALRLVACAGLTVIACSSAEAQRARPDVSELGAQHGVVLSLAAIYYCEMKQWPNDLQQLKAFQEQTGVKLGVEPMWFWLQGGEMKYAHAEDMTLESESPDDKGAMHKVTSGQKPTVCKEGSTEMNGAYINL